MKSRSYLLEDPSHLKLESKRLHSQAKAMLEREFIVTRALTTNPPKKILELGCGNGAALSLVGEKFPSAKLYGYDRNEDLIKQASAALPNAEFYTGDLGDVELLGTAIRHTLPDLILIRYVLQHLSKREISNLFKFVMEAKKPQTEILIIDVDDSLCRFEPNGFPLQVLLEAKGRLQKRNGGDRTIGSQISNLLQDAGCQSVQVEKVSFSNKNMSWDDWNSVFWPVIRSGSLAFENNEANRLIENGVRWISDASSSDNAVAEFSIIVGLAK